MPLLSGLIAKSLKAKQNIPLACVNFTQVGPGSGRGVCTCAEQACKHLAAKEPSKEQYSAAH